MTPEKCYVAEWTRAEFGVAVAGRCAVKCDKVMVSKSTSMRAREGETAGGRTDGIGIKIGWNFEGKERSAAS